MKAFNLRFFLFISFIAEIILHQTIKTFRCGSDKFNNIPKMANNSIDIKKHEPLFFNNEKLEKDDFKLFNISLDLTNIKKEIEIKYNNLKKYENIIINSLEKAKEVFETILTVKKINSGYNFKDEEIKELKINDWDKNKFGTEALKKK